MELDDVVDQQTIDYAREYHPGEPYYHKLVTHKFNSKSGQYIFLAGLIGIAATCGVELSRFFLKYNIEPFESSEAFRWAAGHLKGAFQAAGMLGVGNIVIPEILRNFKAHETVDAYKDHSFKIGTLTMFGGAFTEIVHAAAKGSDIINNFDYADMGMYALGVAFMIGVCKFFYGLAQRQFEPLFVEAKERDQEIVSASSKSAPSVPAA